MNYFVALLVCLGLMGCSEVEKPPMDQKNAEKTPENLRFPPDFYARPVKGEKPVMDLPKI